MKKTTVKTDFGFEVSYKELGQNKYQLLQINDKKVKNKIIVEIKNSSPQEIAKELAKRVSFWQLYPFKGKFTDFLDYRTQTFFIFKMLHAPKDTLLPLKRRVTVSKTRHLLLAGRYSITLTPNGKVVVWDTEEIDKNRTPLLVL